MPVNLHPTFRHIFVAELVSVFMWKVKKLKAGFVEKSESRTSKVVKVQFNSGFMYYFIAQCFSFSCEMVFGLGLARLVQNES